MENNNEKINREPSAGFAAARLLGCPFCGRRESEAPYGPTLEGESVVCKNCGASGPVCETSRHAVRTWNSRIEFKESEILTPEQLKSIRLDLGVKTQDEMSSLLGLGAKTYHKWESGKQKPNLSMCRYIRLYAHTRQPNVAMSDAERKP